jgi:hypothetical protein
VKVVIILSDVDGDGEGYKNVKEFRVVGEQSRVNNIEKTQRLLDNWGVWVNYPTSFDLLRPHSGLCSGVYV